MSIALVHSAPETVAQRVRRLQAEANQAAADHSRDLIAAIAALQEVASEISAAGAPYMPGIANEARILAEECALRVARLTLIMGRAK